MKKDFYLFKIIIFILLFTLASGKNGDDDSIFNNYWEEKDSYTIQLVNNEFVTDKDYILCMEKKSGKDFIILNLTDIHLADKDIGKYKKNYVILKKVIENLVEKVKPNLITVTGDLCNGNEKFLLNVGNIIDQYGIPWAPIFGNHDNRSTDLNTHEQAYLYEKSFKHCLFKSGPENLATTSNGSVAWGNYIINIVERDNSNNYDNNNSNNNTNNNNFHVVKSLLFINSGDNYDYKSDTRFSHQTPLNKENYAMLSTTQINWYKWAIKNVQPYGKNGQVKSALFIHIPLYIYNIAFAAAYNTNANLFNNYRKYIYYVKNDNVFDSYSDKSIWNEGYEHSVGGLREIICSSPFDDHVFEAIKNFNDDDDNTGKDHYLSTDLIVAGHDHVNNFIIEYEGVTLAYSLKTGSGSYYDEDLTGGSVILIHESGKSVIYHQYVNIKKIKFDSWVDLFYYYFYWLWHI